jgi:hypothetical protein
MKRAEKVKIEVSCEVMKDGSLGPVAISTRASLRSGYCLKDPFGPQFDLAYKLVAESFKRSKKPALEEPCK